MSGASQPRGTPRRALPATNTTYRSQRVPPREETKNSKNAERSKDRNGAIQKCPGQDDNYKIKAHPSVAPGISLVDQIDSDLHGKDGQEHHIDGFQSLVEFLILLNRRVRHGAHDQGAQHNEDRHDDNHRCGVDETPARVAKGAPPETVVVLEGEKFVVIVVVVVLGTQRQVIVVVVVVAAIGNIFGELAQHRRLARRSLAQISQHAVAVAAEKAAIALAVRIGHGGGVYLNNRAQKMLLAANTEYVYCRTCGLVARAGSSTVHMQWLTAEEGAGLQQKLLAHVLEYRSAHLRTFCGKLQDLFFTPLRTYYSYLF